MLSRAESMSSAAESVRSAMRFLSLFWPGSFTAPAAESWQRKIASVSTFAACGLSLMKAASLTLGAACSILLSANALGAPPD